MRSIFFVKPVYSSSRLLTLRSLSLGLCLGEDEEILRRLGYPD